MDGGCSTKKACCELDGTLGVMADKFAEREREVEVEVEVSICA